MEEGGFTPLLFASRVGDLGSARLLLAAGADVHGTTPDGASALVVAAHSGHTALAAFLLGEGANPNAAGAGYMALHAAVLRGDPDLVKTLLAHGANPNAPLTRGTVIGRQAKLFMIDGALAGATPFFLAAKYADPRSMRLLADAGADPLLGLKDGLTPLMVAAGMLTTGFSRGGGDRQDREMDTAESEVAFSQDEDLRSILNSGIEAVKLAVHLGADVNAANQAGDTALHSAAYHGFETVIRFLVSKGAKLDVKNKAGRTPLMTAEDRRGADDKSIATITADLLRKLSARELPQD
jgi:ankyrin repeat protein